LTEKLRLAIPPKNDGTSCGINQGMPMLDKPLEHISLADLHDLLNERFPEGKTLDYKRDMYGRSDSEKKELLKDVTSFANTTGGNLIIGMDEANGVPIALMGISVSDVDAEKLRLEEIIRRGTDPRIDFGIHSVETGTGTTVFIIRIKESWILPHRVVYQGQFGEFWARNSAGKYSMDTTELRRAFNLSETIYGRVRAFREERVAEIGRGNTPIELKNRARLILHLIPLEALRARVALKINDVPAFAQTFPPIGSQKVTSYSPRLNFDGIVLYSGGGAEDTASTYAQLYRNGTVETASDDVSYEIEGKYYLATQRFESHLMHELGTYLKSFQALSIACPIWGFLTLIGVKGMSIKYQGDYIHDRHEIERDVLSLPEFVIEDLDTSPVALLRPSFDLIWNAAGLACSFNFDEEGRFRPR
jgi:hypothetical protein